jgi:hypothetical protein
MTMDPYNQTIANAAIDNRNSAMRENHRANNNQYKYNNLVGEYNALLKTKNDILGLKNQQEEQLKLKITRVENTFKYIQELIDRSDSPSNETMRELSLRLYVGELVGITPEFCIYNHPSNWSSANWPLMQKRAVNLKILARAEWYSLDRFTYLLNTFQNTLLVAFASPTKENEYLRDPKRLVVINREIKAHNELMTEAKESTDGSVQKRWELERVEFWKIHGIYSKQYTIPILDEINTSVWYDHYCAPGRIARDAGINIETLELTNRYLDRQAVSMKDSPNSFWVVDWVLNTYS